MIRYALACTDCDHAFEAWFGSSSAYDEQAKKGLITCPSCNGSEVEKQIMAPAVSGTKKSRQTMAQSPDKAGMEAMIEAARTYVDQNFDYVGDGFADEARAIHYGETEARPIWGETTPEESAALKEEGVEAAPLPPAITPVKRKPQDKLN